MADQTSITMTSRDQGGSKLTTSVNYVNPNASNTALLQLAEKLNNLTVNTLESVSKTVKTNIDVDASKDPTTLRFSITSALADGNPGITSLTFAQILQSQNNWISDGIPGAYCFIHTGTLANHNSNVPYVTYNDTSYTVAVIDGNYKENDVPQTHVKEVVIGTLSNDLITSDEVKNTSGTIIFHVDADATHAAADFTLTITKE